MLLGWAPKDNRELFTLTEFVEHFDVNGFQDANPRFLEDKLNWFNGEYIRKLSDESLNLLFKSQNPKFADLSKEKQTAITKIVKDRIKKISDFDNLAGFFLEKPKIDIKLFGSDSKEHLSDAILILKSIKDWSLETLNSNLMALVKEKGYKTGDFFMDLRIAVAGSKFTPPINDSMIILGKEESISRIKAAI
jgi:glutamyl-tRNA synthetase